MASPVPAPTRIRFDEFELDVTSGELRKGGILLKLQPQPFRVLLLLVERAGQVVTREEIQRCLWTESTFVDFEHGINFSINQIRGALADSAENPRYVETLPRRGYRFIGTVEQPSAESITVLKRAPELASEDSSATLAHDCVADGDSRRDLLWSGVFSLPSRSYTDRKRYNCSRRLYEHDRRYSLRRYIAAGTFRTTGTISLPKYYP